MERKIRIGPLISGGGTNMQAIVKACKNGKINGEVVFVGSDDPSAAGLAWAREQGIDTFTVNYQAVRESVKRDPFIGGLAEEGLEEFRAAAKFIHGWFGGNKAKQLAHLRWKIAAERLMLENILRYDIDLLVLAGFMQVCTPFLIDYLNNGPLDPRIMNIHPALLPAFPGVDGYGDTFRYGCKVGGCTVHFVDYGEDTGLIIGQAVIPVLEGETLDDFRHRGLEQEYILYPKCIQLFAEGRLKIEEVEQSDGSLRKIVGKL